MATLELELPPSDLARLLRAPALLALRQGRMRTTQASIVWHDTPEGTLASDGMSLCQGASARSRLHWRLERLHPDCALGWLPGAPAPLLAEGAALDALGRGMPDRLAPVAALHGTLRRVSLGGGRWLTVLDGRLRGVAQDRAVCWLTLHGEAAEIAALACRLGEVARVGTPRAGLAAQAIAVATGRPAVPRHVGGPAIPPGTSVAHLADTILHWAVLVPGGRSPEPVHQMRVAIRRLRSAFSVFRPVAQAGSGQSHWLDELDAALKAVAAQLGAARDWDVFLAETGEDVTLAFGGDRRIAQLLAACRRRRAAAYAALEESLQASAWTRLQLTLALLPTTRPWDAGASPEQADLLAAPVQAFAARALDRRFKHVVSPGRSLAGLPADALHEVRKQAKRLRYAVELFAPLFPAKQVRRYASRLERLQAVLGAVNDTAVAAALMSQLGGGSGSAFAAGVVQGFGAGRSALATRRVERAWVKFYRASPFWD